MNKGIPILVFSLMAFFLFSCNSAPTKKTSLTIESVIVAEGPLFEGSNTAQSEVKTLEALNELSIPLEDIKNASLVSCDLSIVPVSDSAEVQNFDIMQSISFSFAADELDMQAAGVLNPMPSGKNDIQLNIAKEQEQTLEFLKQKMFYLVADANLEQDLNDNLEIKCKLVFDINY
jgi:hypothetical protein